MTDRTKILHKIDQVLRDAEHNPDAGQVTGRFGRETGFELPEKPETEAVPSNSAI